MEPAIAHFRYVQGLLVGNNFGREDGALMECRRLLLRLLRNKFGEIPLAYSLRIGSTDRRDLLEKWFDQACVANCIYDVTVLRWRERRRKSLSPTPRDHNSRP